MAQNNHDKIRGDFDRIYAEVVTEAMKVLGEGTSVITNYLEQKFSFSLADTVDNPQALSEALSSALDGSARIIQRRILRLLYERMNMKYPLYMTINFEERIFEVKKAYEKLDSSSPPSREAG